MASQADVENTHPPLTEAREKISAFVVCFNEEREIGACLETLQFCDEIIVIDSFSTDRTVEICKELGANVIQRPWPGYRAQKAFGLAETKHEWVLNLDADERVSDELRQSIEAVLRREWQVRQSGSSQSGKPLPDGYEMNRVVYYLERWWRKGGWYPEYRVRLVRKSKCEWGGIDPHERPIVHGPIERIAGELHHYTYRSMDEQVKRLHAHATIAAKEDHKRGKTVGISRILLSPVVRIVKFYIFKRGYREGIAGLIVALMEGFYTFLKYAKVWELQQQAANRKEE
jgi:glycosyltransferase involved in cell wall biosynthesis